MIFRAFVSFRSFSQLTSDLMAAGASRESLSLLAAYVACLIRPTGRASLGGKRGRLGPPPAPLAPVSNVMVSEVGAEML
jgi:hypothetical protein